MMIYGEAVFWVYRDEVLGPILTPVATATARLVLAALGLIGIDASREGAAIAHPNGFAYEIAYTCTGFLPVSTFIVCILAYPGTWCAKGIGVALGVPVLLAVNMLRLVDLFYIGVHFPHVFAWAHEVLWQALQVVEFIALWLGWIGWSTRWARLAK